MVTTDIHPSFWHSLYSFIHLLLTVQFLLAFEFATLDLPSRRQSSICSVTLRLQPSIELLVRRMRARSIKQLIQSPLGSQWQSPAYFHILQYKNTKVTIYILHCHICKGLKYLLNYNSTYQNVHQLHLSSCPWVIGERRKSKNTNNKDSSKIYDMLRISHTNLKILPLISIKLYNKTCCS